MPRRVNVRTCRKHHVGACFFCGTFGDCPELLEAHRILPGEDGGRYHWANILPVCSNCHTLIHAEKIIIHGRFIHSAGYYVIYFTENGEEKFEREDRWNIK